MVLPARYLTTYALASETLIAQFVTTEGETAGPKLALPRDISLSQLHTLLNDHILKNVCALWFWQRLIVSGRDFAVFFLRE